MKTLKLIIATISLLQLQTIKPSVSASVCMLWIESQKRQALQALLEKERTMYEQENIAPDSVLPKEEITFAHNDLKNLQENDFNSMLS